MTYPNLRIHLIIKGDKLTAARAAADRGIPFAYLRESQWGAVWETKGFAPESYRGKIEDWYLEPPNSAPYPDGSLLLYADA